MIGRLVQSQDHSGGCRPLLKGQERESVSRSSPSFQVGRAKLSTLFVLVERLSLIYHDASFEHAAGQQVPSFIPCRPLGTRRYR